MAVQGVDVQINGGWLDSFGYELPPYKGHAWSRFLEEHLIAASNGKDNLRALGSVTLQDGEKAALLLEGLVGEDLVGVMIGTQLHGDHSNLDDSALNPFWAVASDHKAEVFIHQMYGCNDIRLNDYDIITAVGQGLETITALVSMSVILPHNADGLPRVLGRLYHKYYHLSGSKRRSGRRALAYLFCAVVFDPDARKFLMAKADADRVMMGSGYSFPIGDHEPKGVVHAAGLSANVALAVLGGNAVKPSHLEAGCDEHH